MRARIPRPASASRASDSAVVLASAAAAISAVRAMLPTAATLAASIRLLRASPLSRNSRATDTLARFRRETIDSP